MPKFNVIWDNGNNACGTFPYVFESEESARKFGQEWADNANAECPPGEGEDIAYFDVIELNKGDE